MVAIVLSSLAFLGGADEFLARAETRIQAHRTGDLTVLAVDAAGKAIAGAAVAVEQERHDFLFGCNIFALGSFPDPEREAAYRARFKELLNYATLPFYWAPFEPRRGEPDYARVEAMARWCRENGITVKGHPLVWNHPAGVPAWLPGDLEEVRKLLVARVGACARRFRGTIDIWDVVNEASDPYRFGEDRISSLMKKIGVRAYLFDAFDEARAANPEARLLINDYRVGDDYVNVVRMLGEEGKRRYDAIGIQSHMHGGAWRPDRAIEVCDRFAAFGVPLHFTETTIVSGPRVPGTERWGPTEPALEERQARETAMFYTAVFSHPAVTALTWWDFSDARAWQGAAAGFLREDCSPKPVYDELKKRIRGTWWTASEARTDAAGRATVRAFFGRHAVRVAGPSGARASVTVDFPRPWPPPETGRVTKEIRVELR